MSCESIDLKGYVLEEVSPADRDRVNEHLGGCSGCREELERLRATSAALLAVPDEEIPRRIAFVSDKVFEPRWWQRVWRSGPAMGFAAAAMLAVAIVAHAMIQPRVAPAPAVASIGQSQVQAMVEAEVARRVDAAVTQAVAVTEARQKDESAGLLAAAEQRHQREMEDLRLAVDESLQAMQKKLNVWQVASNRGGGQ